MGLVLYRADMIRNLTVRWVRVDGIHFSAFPDDMAYLSHRMDNLEITKFYMFVCVDYKWYCSRDICTIFVGSECTSWGSKCTECRWHECRAICARIGREEKLCIT